MRVASEPELSVAAVSVLVATPHTSDASVPKPVSVRVPFAQMSDTNVPNDVSVLPEKAQIDPGNVAESEEEAVAMAVLVLVLTSAATEVDETMLLVISKVLSARIRLPFPEEPHDMTVRQIPTVPPDGVNEYEYQLLASADIEAALTDRLPPGSYTLTVQPAVVVA